MDDGELITNAFALLGQGRFEAADAYFERYMAGRVRVCGVESLRAAWQGEVASMRRLLAEREREERERAERRGGGFWGAFTGR